MSDSSHLKSRNLLADAFVAAGLNSNIVNEVRLPGRQLLPNTKAALDVIESLVVERDKYRAHSEMLNRFLWRIAGRLGLIKPGNDGVLHANPEEVFDTFMQRHLEADDKVAVLRDNYEQLRKVIDKGSESMTHSDALELVQKWADNAEEVVLDPANVCVNEFPKQRSGVHVGMPKGVEVAVLSENIVVICDSERSQHLNRDRALAGVQAMIKHKGK